MPTPYNIEIQQSCLSCTHRTGRFCDVSNGTLTSLEAVKFTTVYPKGSLLFVEGEKPRGVFILCSGRAKLTTSSSEGKTIIAKIAEAGEILGVSAAVLNTPYELSAETLEPAQVNFIRSEDFLAMLNRHPDASMRTAQQLSATVQSAQRQIRNLGLAQTTTEKLARLILDWCDKGEQTAKGTRLKVLLTHEEIAQRIGTTRETVTRLFSDFKRRKLIEVKGSTVLVPTPQGLLQMVSI
jgi:CRP/FNR family cyclic AMP-dependent transcriptional regulator